MEREKLGFTRTTEEFEYQIVLSIGAISDDEMRAIHRLWKSEGTLDISISHTDPQLEFGIGGGK